jgi:hypothetical protein
VVSKRFVTPYRSAEPRPKQPPTPRMTIRHRLAHAWYFNRVIAEHVKGDDGCSYVIIRCTGCTWTKRVLHSILCDHCHRQLATFASTPKAQELEADLVSVLYAPGRSATGLMVERTITRVLRLLPDLTW